MIEARRLLAALLIGQVACVLAIAFHLMGAAERLDLMAYDQGVRLRADSAGTDDRIVLVTVHEPDIAEYGWPLNDGQLADLLDILSQAGPRAIGVDIYRDRPVPPGTDRLNTVLNAQPGSIWGYLFGV